MGNTALLTSIPGISPTILGAAGKAVRQSYLLGFRYVWVTAGVFAALAVIGAAFLVDPKAEFTGHIDAPVESEEELHRGHGKASGQV